MKIKRWELYAQQKETLFRLTLRIVQMKILLSVHCKSVYAEAATRGVLYKNVFLKTSQNSQQKNLCQGLFFNKVAGLKPATLLKKILWHRCFPVNFVKCLRIRFLQAHLDNCFCLCFLSNVMFSFECFFKFRK